MKYQILEIGEVILILLEAQTYSVSFISLCIIMYLLQHLVVSLILQVDLPQKLDNNMFFYAYFRLG